MGIKEKFTRKYKTKDLYVGLLGIVNCKFLGWDDEEFSYNSVNRYVIYRKKKYVPAADGFCGDYVGEDLFTNREYFFFRGNKNTFSTVYKAVGSLAICKFYPLELFLPSLGDTVTKSQLLELCNILNKIAKKGDYGDSDRFCETLAKINSLLDTSLVDGDLRRTMSEELEKLKQYYIEAELDSLIYKKKDAKTKRRIK